MDYEIYDAYEDDPLPNPLWRRIRLLIFAAIMLCAMLGGAIYPAWSIAPSILGYWQNDYRVRISRITAGTCENSANVSYSVQQASSIYCICGTVDANDGTADFHIYLQDASQQTLGTINLFDTASGGFCRALQLNDILEAGRYSLVIQPRLARNPVSRTNFIIREFSSGVSNDS